MSVIIPPLLWAMEIRCKMDDTTSSSLTVGDGSVGVIGNGNDIDLEFHPFQMSILHQVCKAIMESDISVTPEDDYSLKTNSNWMKKFEYNKVVAYIDIFDDEAPDIDQLEEVMEGFPNRVLMINKIKHIYRMVAKESPESEFDGDFVLETVFKDLCKVIDESGFPADDQTPLEQMERYIKLVMFYAFTKCQLLKPVDN